MTKSIQSFVNDYYTTISMVHVFEISRYSEMNASELLEYVSSVLDT